MNYSKEIKSFANSHYFSEGVRITSGVLLPALFFGYFHMLSAGIVVSLGALLVSVTDSPGPIHYRKNGMAATIVSMLLVTIAAGFASASPPLLLIVLAVCCFFFTMIAIYGARATSIGIATLIVLTLTIDPQHNLTTPAAILQYSFLVTVGGIWYMSYSLLLYNFTPYRLPRQSLGDIIQATAEYFRLRAELYRKEVNYKLAYDNILHQQAVVQQKQNDLSELLLKTRSIVKESTNIGRTLVMMHFDVSDIFEKIMMSHQSYSQLHEYFDESGILNDYHSLVLQLANDLDRIGIAVKSGERTTPDAYLTRNIEVVKVKLDDLRRTELKPANIEGFISLRRIFENIQDLAERLAILHRYTAYDESLTKKLLRKETIDRMITSQQVDPALFVSNLTIKSDTFRHALRLTIAVVAGYILAHVFSIGRSYWILLTIIVILKPAYSLTKKRNSDRLFGTVGGMLIGVIIVQFITNSAVLLALVIVFMIGGYSSMRKNYFISVLLMTAYLVLFYHMLNPKDFSVLLKDRIVDTVIGGVIAFLASIFLFPSWERNKIKPITVGMLKEVNNYFSLVSEVLKGNSPGRTTRQLARKNALVALANLSDAFTRMLSEPESQQKDTKTLHKFVVLNHTFTFYVATLLQYIQAQLPDIDAADFLQVTEEVQQLFDDAIASINGSSSQNIDPEKRALRKLNDHASELLERRVDELNHGMIETPTRQSLLSVKSLVDQLNLVYNVAADINKVAKELKLQ